ncbi:MAG: acyltransferase [Marinomonas sp.]
MSGPATGKAPVLQLDALTGLRGIAAWLVVFYHIRLSLTALLPSDTIAFLAKGYLAVDLFFMLSGFVMWLNYGDRFAQNGLRETPSFLWKRVARIWPLHALIMAGMIAFAALLIVTKRPIDEYPLGELPLHIMLVQNWGFTDALSWNHPAWSISTELGAYLVFPLIVCAIAWRQLSAPVLLAILGAALAGLYGFFALNGLTDLGDNIAQMGLVRCIIEFFIGIVLANIWQRFGQGLSATLCWALAACAAALIGMFANVPETAFMPVLIASILMIFASNAGKFAAVLSAKPLLWLGDISYATYLVHYFAFILFKIAFVGPDLQLSWMQLAAFLAGIMAMSAALYCGFEKPAQRWMNARSPFAKSVRMKPSPSV